MSSVILGMVATLAPGGAGPFLRLGVGQGRSGGGDDHIGMLHGGGCRGEGFLSVFGQQGHPEGEGFGAQGSGCLEQALADAEGGVVVQDQEGFTGLQPHVVLKNAAGDFHKIHDSASSPLQVGCLYPISSLTMLAATPLARRTGLSGISRTRERMARVYPMQSRTVISAFHSFSSSAAVRAASMALT